MALETLTNYSCIRELEKDMISESLQVNIHIVKDLLRNQTAKFKPDTALVKRLEGQQIFIKNINHNNMAVGVSRLAQQTQSVVLSKVLSEDLKVKVDNILACKQ